MGLASNHRAPRLILITVSTIQDRECSFVLIVYISIPNVLYRAPQKPRR